MSGTKPPVIHRVSVLDLVVEAWTWPFAETRRAEIAAHFADKQREKPAMWNGRVLLGRNPVFSGDRFSASYFETDFASFLAWRDWGFPDRFRVQRFRHGRAALRRRRLRARRDGPAHVERRAHLFSVRHARPRRHQGRHGRHIRQRHARARGGDRPCARRIRERAALALHLHRTCGCDDPHVAGRYAGRRRARPDRGQSRRAASAGIIRHPPRARHPRSHLRNAAFCHGLHRGAVRFREP